jgi:hypothetical protein
LQRGDVQAQKQAERNFVNAVLRKESGAVISDSEFKNAERQYFPRSGDSKEVLAQKAANRALVIESFRNLAGPAWENAGGSPGLNEDEEAELRALEALEGQ